MRIGMLLSTPLPPQEGIGFHVWNLAKYLVEQGHEVHLITRRYRASPSPVVREGMNIWSLPYLPLFPLHVHFHNLFVSGLVRRLEAEKKLDLLHIHSPLVLPPRTSLPILVTVHSPLKFNIQATRLSAPGDILIRLQAPFSFQVESTLYRKARKLLAVSSHVVEELVNYGIDPSEVSIIGNGVDTSFFAPDETVSQQPQPYFLTVGRIAAGKGLEDLIEAGRLVVQRYPDIRFMIAGDGPLYTSLQRAIHNYRLDNNIILTGQIADRLLLRQYYQEALAYVHPSHYEGLPTALLEAMACGQIVIATAIKGHLDIVEHGKNGLLVPPRQPHALAEALVGVIEKSVPTKHLGQQARQTICERYAWPRIGERYLAEYRALLERRI